LAIMDNKSNFKLLYSRQQIDITVKKLAEEIARDLQYQNPLVLGILKGSFLFMADLVRALDFPLQIEFVRLSSYGDSMESSGQVKMVQGIDFLVENRDILVIEDIVDTGFSVSFLLDYLREKNPASVRLCALIDKPSRREVKIDIDYTGLSAPDKFLIGYGLDWDEKYRNLPDIYTVEE